MKKLLTIVAASALVIALGAVVIFAVTDRSDTADDMVSGGDPSSVTSGLEPQDSSDISVSTSDGDQQASSDSTDSSDTSSSDTQDSSADSSDTQTMTESRRPVGTYHPSGDRLLPIYNVETSEKKCAISFDAAWGADQTENILAILDEYNVKATFFLVGRWVDEFPEMVEKIAAAGHDVMNHSNTHADLATLSTAEIIEEIETCNDKIEAITGVRPALIRLPYGSYNNTVIEAVRSLGMEPIQWDVDSLDWQEGITSSDIYDRITSKTTSGSIILCHNAGEGTPAALPDLFEKLIGDGYEFTTIYDLIIKDDYTIDGTGKQKAQ